jgi:hypothetical protein
MLRPPRPRAPSAGARLAQPRLAQLRLRKLPRRRPTRKKISSLRSRPSSTPRARASRPSTSSSGRAMPMRRTHGRLLLTWSTPPTWSKSTRPLLRRSQLLRHPPPRRLLLSRPRRLPPLPRRLPPLPRRLPPLPRRPAPRRLAAQLVVQDAQKRPNGWR